MSVPLTEPNFGVCSLCGGEDEAGHGTKGKRYCDVCWPIVQESRSAIVYRSHFDQLARDYAGVRGGEYLEKLGKTDIATLTECEWSAFLDTLFRAKQSELRRLHSPGAPPL